MNTVFRSLVVVLAFCCVVEQAEAAGRATPPSRASRGQNDRPGAAPTRIQRRGPLYSPATNAYAWGQPAAGSYNDPDLSGQFATLRGYISQGDQLVQQGYRDAVNTDAYARAYGRPAGAVAQWNAVASQWCAAVGKAEAAMSQAEAQMRQAMAASSNIQGLATYEEEQDKAWRKDYTLIAPVQNDSERQYVNDQKEMYEARGFPPDRTARLALEDLQFQRNSKELRIGDTYFKSGFDYYDDLMGRLMTSQSPMDQMLGEYVVAPFAALGYAAADVSMGGPARALSNLLQDSSTPWERIKGGVLLPLELIASTGTGGPLGKGIAHEAGELVAHGAEVSVRLSEFLHATDPVGEGEGVPLLYPHVYPNTPTPPEREPWGGRPDVDLRGAQLDPEAVKYANQKLAEKTSIYRQLTMSPGDYGDYPARRLWMDHYLNAAGGGTPVWGSSGP